MNRTMTKKLKNIQHVVIIPDGNRRWAKAQGMPGPKGHIAGAKAAQKILQAAHERKIHSVTIWGGSYDNLTKRSKLELKGLFKIYHKMLKDLFEDDRISRDNIRVRILGEWRAILPESTCKVIHKIHLRTKNNNKHNFSILLGYNGDREMLESIQSLIDTGKKVTPERMKRSLSTRDLPPADLVIRTGAGGVPHNSNGFMMWDTRNAYLYFTDTTWPAFTPSHFNRICDRYDQEKRRYGR